MNRFAWLFVTGCTLAASGCASLSPQGAFQDVQAKVIDRIEKRVQWRQDDHEDTEIQTLLQGTLSADQAVQIALLNNRSLQAVYAELGIAQADLVEAGLMKNPIFEAELRFPGRPDNPFELHVIQDFIDVFFIPLRRKVAGAALEAAKLRVAQAVLEHAAETRRTFYQIQGSEQLIDMRKTTVEALQASALLAERQHEAGNISDLDFANEQAAFEQSRIDLALAETEAIDQRERLNELMGVWGSEAGTWRIATRLPEPPNDEVAAEGLETLAVTQRLDLAATRQQVESLAQSLGLARNSALLTQLEISGHVEQEPEGDATWGPSVGLPLPIFNQGQPTIARAAAQLRRSQQQYYELAVKMRAEVRSARNRMLSARLLVQHYKTVVLPLRAKIVEETQLHYNAMQIGPSQLLQAKQGELEAGRAYVETLKSYWVARADLERAVGGRLPSPSHVQTTTPQTIPNALSHTSSHEDSQHGGHP